jgi:hypothetical protein
MSVTYYVALPFVQTEGGIAAGQAVECPNEPVALRRAEIMARSPAKVGAPGVQAHGRSEHWQLWRCHGAADVRDGAGQSR